jgi:hypothetical protein
MPRASKGEKRPADVIGNAIRMEDFTTRIWRLTVPRVSMPAARRGGLASSAGGPRVYPEITLQGGQHERQQAYERF